MKNLKRLFSFSLALLVLSQVIYTLPKANAICCRKDSFDKSRYSLTGNMAHDVAVIAKSQQGRTCDQFGYSGDDYGAWCDEYVADCLENAGADSSVVAHGGTVDDFENKMRSRGAVTVSIPKEGDLVFFGTAHVEIISSVVNGVAYCSGGNNGDYPGRCDGERRLSDVENWFIQYRGIGAAHFLRPNYPGQIVDTIPPTISNPSVSDLSGASFTINCDLSDNTGIASVWLNVYGPNGSEKGYRVNASNGRFSHTIQTSDYGGSGEYAVHIYPADAYGNAARYAFESIYAITDSTPPTISNPFVSNISNASFTINCDLDDNVGVTNAWLNIYGPNGETGYRVDAANGRFSYTIQTTAHGGPGEYAVHIYPADAAGNAARYAFESIIAKSDTTPPTISNQSVTNITDSSFTINCHLDDNVGVTRVWLVVYGMNQENGYAVFASNGAFSHTIQTSDYGGTGRFVVHMYVQDAAGNEIGYAFDPIITTPLLINSIPNKGHVYELYSSRITWNDAKRIAETKGGHLATITSSEEQSVISSILTSNTNIVWIGLSDQEEEDNWKWVSGESYDFNYWQPQQPDNYNNSEHYVHIIYPEGAWNDATASDVATVGFVIEYDSPCNGNHLWNDGDITKAATCIDNGEKEYICTVCSATKTETIAKNTSNHTGGTEVRNAIAATCGSDGYTDDTYCKGCGAKLSSGTAIPATGKHTWNAGTVTTAATCKSTGVKTYTCTVCSATKTETIAKDANNHTGGTEVKNATAATCGADGYTGDIYCKGCGVKLSSGTAIPATGEHAWNDGEIITPATATAAGEKVFTCTVCGTEKTEPIPVRLNITVQPKSITAAPEGMASFSVGATGAGVTYRWRSRTSKDDAWVYSTDAGSDTAQITFTAKEADNGRQYQCVITDAAGNKRYSAIATLTVQALAFTAHPKNMAAAPEGAVSFSVGATGAGVTYRWRYRTSKDGAWMNCTAAGSDTAQITFTAKEADNGSQYQCVITDAAGNKRYSAIATLTVQALGFTTHPKNTAAAPEGTVSFSVGATGAGVTYRWRYRTSKDGAWVNCTAAGSDTAKITFTATEVDNGRQYQCVITDAAGNKRYSAIATLTVQALAFTAHPKNAVAVPEGTASFSVGASGAGISYRWRYRTSKDGAWVNCTAAGSDTAQITFTATEADNGRQYQCVITDAAGNKRYSAIATLTVQALGFTAHPKNVVTAPEETATFSVAATGAGVTYRWRYRTSKDGAWVNCTAAGSDTAQITFTATEADNGRQYQCVITDAGGNVRYSGVGTLTVK